MTDKPETAPDTAHSAIVTDHPHRTMSGKNWGPCIWTYPDGHVCGVAQAAHDESISPYILRAGTPWRCATCVNTEVFPCPHQNLRGE